MLDIETFRHNDLRVQVAEKAKKNLRNHQTLIKTNFISYKAVVQLGKEKEAKNRKSKSKKEAVLKRERILPVAPPDPNSDWEVWEEEYTDIESISGTSEESRVDDMEDVIVVARKQ